MKKIAVFFRIPGAMDYPFSKPDYWTSYSELSQEVANHGGQLYFTREQHTYLGNGSFSQSWIIENNSLVETGPITVEVIYDKGRFEPDNTVPILNHAKIKRICDDKWLMYQHFSEYCPTTFFVENEMQIHSALPKLKTDLLVFKPFSGSEGTGVTIEKKEFFMSNLDTLQYPGVFSEFIDTSIGVPHIVEGLHDLRLAIFDGDILYSYFRTPPQGSFLANVSKGGRFEMVDPSNLPKEILTIARKIDSEFSECGHRFYSIDFGYTKDGPKIIEMNSELGLLPNKDHPVFVTLKEKLAQTFMDM